MKISNFTNSELEKYYNNKEIIFFNFRRCFILIKENNIFKFTEFKKAKTLPGELPHTKKGRFHSFKINSSYCSNYDFKQV